MNREELKEMREGICAAHQGLKYFATYSEEQAAMFMGKDPSTLKRWRNAKKIFPVVEPGGKGIRYFGFQIADMIMGRPQPWDATASEISGLENTGLVNEKALPPSTVAGSKVDGPSALRLARQTLKTQSKS